MPDYLDTIVVDFDDTLCTFNENFTCSELVPGAKEYIARLSRLGFKIVISSARNNIVYGGFSGEAHRQMHKFLEEVGITYDRIDLGTDGKPVAYR